VDTHCMTSQDGQRKRNQLVAGYSRHFFQFLIHQIVCWAEVIIVSYQITDTERHLKRLDGLVVRGRYVQVRALVHHNSSFRRRAR
jgi:hypothetical protein